MASSTVPTRPPNGGTSEDGRSRHALDALSFFIADAQTGFGPFIASYLTGLGWSSTDIGTMLGIGTVSSLFSQLPAGALVDRLHDKRIGAAAAWAAMAAGAVLFAVAPSRAFVAVAEILHSFASSMLGPAVAAISLALVGRKALGERLGRNARYAAIGNAVTAAVLGAAGAWMSSRSVFWLTAAFVVPGVVLLFGLPRPEQASRDLDPVDREASGTTWRGWFGTMGGLFSLPGVVGFALCVALFHLSNAALLPLASTVLARTAGGSAPLFVAACVVVPQIGVALLSPWVGRSEARRGLRPMLVVGFSAVPLRAVLLALAASLGDRFAPYGIVAAQVIDGVSGAVFGVAMPLVAADLTKGSNRFNLCLGFFSVAVTAGATLGTMIAGRVADHFGFSLAFILLAAFGVAAVAAVLFTVRDGPG